MLAVLYCAAHGMDFRLSSRYGSNFEDCGWTEYFEPFCEEINSSLLHRFDLRSPLDSSFTKRIAKELQRCVLKVCIKPFVIPGEKTTVDCWEQLRALRSEESVHFHLVSGSYTLPLREALHRIHNEIWVFNADMLAFIETARFELALPERYAALHIRRGDKDIEAALEDESRYLQRLQEHSDLRDVYVMTDDYAVVDSLKRQYGDYRWYSRSPKLSGYVNKDFHGLAAGERASLIRNLLCENELMRRAEVFVGTFSSNIGVYQGIARSSQSYGVDYPEWLFW